MPHLVYLFQLKLIVALCLSSGSPAVAIRTFTVDSERNTFLKDGQPFRYVSGSMHYFRVPQIYWRDRLRKMRACGLDAVETYIPWNFHSFEGEGRYVFDGRWNVSEYLRVVKEEGLLAIVRGFPYSDAEWDMGGLPSWLLSSKRNSPIDPITLRSSDPRFITAVSDWLDVIIPILMPHMYSRGGPVILIQVENEYGSYQSHDDAYLQFLYSSIRKRLNEESVVLFTTDGNGLNDLKRGGVEGALRTVDFGPGSSVADSFAILRQVLPHGPLVNSEFYAGWLDSWGGKHHRTSSDDICSTFDKILSMNASVNFYMFTGGTNFGYWSGSSGPPIKQVTTSYDYDSPVSENGDTTDKFFRIRQIISKYKVLPPMNIPPNITTHSYGVVNLLNKGPIWDYIDVLSPGGPIRSFSPLSYEDLNVQGGFVLYRTSVQASWTGPCTLSIPNSVRDIGKVFVNQAYIGDVVRETSDNLYLGSCRRGDKIDIIVESKGRICYGSFINDSKGIDGVVKLIDNLGKSTLLNGWEMWALHLENIGKISNLKQSGQSWAAPSIYVGTILPEIEADTFVAMPNDKWSAGYVVVNGFNLGKYNVNGPQETLYLPTKALVKNGSSLRIGVLETSPSKYCSGVGSDCPISLVKTPNLG